jgi:hypothetical protein
MAFQVKDLMVTLEPRVACGPATIDSNCPTASATLLLACGPATIGPPIPTGLTELEAVSDTRQRLALLRHQLGAAMARFN